LLQALTKLGNTNTKAVQKAGDVTDLSHFMRRIERVSWDKGGNHDHFPQATSIPGIYSQAAECSCCREGG